MKHAKLYAVLLVSFITGTLFFCIYHEWLIIYWNKPSLTVHTVPGYTKRMAQISLWKHADWHSENIQILQPENKGQATQMLIAQWILLNKEEGLADNNLSLETVLYSPSGQDMYISFDRSPLRKNWSAHDKLFCIESLLKTLRDNNLGCQNVHFFIHHQPLADTHLDFSIAWPLTGFLKDGAA